MASGGTYHKCEYDKWMMRAQNTWTYTQELIKLGFFNHDGEGALDRPFSAFSAASRMCTTRRYFKTVGASQLRLQTINAFSTSCSEDGLGDRPNRRCSERKKSFREKV